jgi:replicative DNA helicase
VEDVQHPCNDVQTLEKAIEAAIDRVEATNVREQTLVGLSTGFPTLDSLTSGLLGGSLTVIAARPAMGRSVLLLDICRHAALQQGVPTLHVSLEHGVTETTLRLIAAECRIALHHMRSGAMTENDEERIARRMPKVSNAPLYFWSPPRLTAAGLAERAYEEVETRGIGLIAIDGVQDIRPEKRNDLREREVGDVVRDLKTLARELDVPLVCTSHLNRAPELRTDRVPISTTCGSPEPSPTPRTRSFCSTGQTPTSRKAPEPAKRTSSLPSTGTAPRPQSRSPSKGTTAGSSSSPTEPLDSGARWWSRLCERRPPPCVGVTVLAPVR